jgi:hypothetical protein
VSALRPRLVVLVALALASVSCNGPVTPAASVSSVSGSATGFLSNVSLFGGPSTQRGPVGDPGCDPNQPAPGPNTTPTEGCSPSVVLPSTGSDAPLTLTDFDGARAVYGPGVVFAGTWPEGSVLPPPSGPITVSTEGTTGRRGSVTSSVHITSTAPPATWVPAGLGMAQVWRGGVGPGPILAEEVTSTCTASQSDPDTGATSTTASTTISHGELALTTDDSGISSTFAPIPSQPPPNDGPHHGVISNVGDSYDVYYNEQDTSVPGSTTVTAIHMRLLGPVAVGDLYIGQSHCGVKQSSSDRRK